MEIKDDIKKSGNEIEIGGLILEDEIEIGAIEMDIQKVYPELEDIEITPSNKDKVYKSENYYGYNEVIVKGVEGATEDLTVELTEQDNLITNQKNALVEAFSKLQGKAFGGGTGNVLPTIEGNTLVFTSGTVDGGVLSI